MTGHPYHKRRYESEPTPPDPMDGVFSDWLKEMRAQPDQTAVERPAKMGPASVGTHIDPTTGLSAKRQPVFERESQNPLRDIVKGEGVLGGIAGLVPGVGEGQMAVQAKDLFKGGHPIKGAGLAALGIVPGIGSLKKLGKAASAIPERIGINMSNAPNAAWDVVGEEGQLVRRFKTNAQLDAWKDKHGFRVDPSRMGMYARRDVPIGEP